MNQMTDPVEIQARRIALAHEVLTSVAELGALASRSKVAEAVEIVAGLEETVRALAGTVEEWEGALCWRCGANLTPPAAEISVQVSVNIRAAGWAGWSEEEFTLRMREALASGDRIVAIRAGAVIVRRRDGSVTEIPRGRA